MAKGKVKEVTFNREWAPDSGAFINYYFNIQIEKEDNTILNGFFSTNKKDQNKFIVGSEIEYRIIEGKEDKNGQPKIDRPETDKSPKAVTGKKWKRDVTVRRSIIAQSSLDTAVTALNAIINTWPELKVQDKITKISQVGSIADNMMKWIAQYSGSNEQMEIICQSSLKRAVAIIPIKSLKIKSTTDILNAAKEFKDMAIAGTETLIPLIPE